MTKMTRTDRLGQLKLALDKLLREFDPTATLNDINLILSITGDEE